MQALDKFTRFVIHVGTRSNYTKTRLRKIPHTSFGQRLVFSIPADKCAVTLTCEEHFSGYRNCYNTKYRCTVVNECDIHRELAITLDKLLRSVKRIDHPEIFPLTAFCIRNGLPFLT